MKPVQHNLLRNTLYRAIERIDQNFIRLALLLLALSLSILMGSGGPEGGGAGNG